LPELVTTFEEMHQTMKINNGIGLAAPQVGLNLNAFVMNVMGNKRTCINPSILSVSPEMENQEEGCLSFPGLRLPVNRPFSIIANWIDETGKEHTESLMGLEARCFLHEWDHCQGICFTDRVGKVTLHLAKKKARRKK
jgi:peptide deformylase